MPVQLLADAPHAGVSQLAVQQVADVGGGEVGERDYRLDQAERPSAGSRPGHLVYRLAGSDIGLNMHRPGHPARTGVDRIFAGQVVTAKGVIGAVDPRSHGAGQAWRPACSPDVMMSVHDLRRHGRASSVALAAYVRGYPATLGERSLTEGHSWPAGGRRAAARPQDLALVRKP